MFAQDFITSCLNYKIVEYHFASYAESENC